MIQGEGRSDHPLSFTPTQEKSPMSKRKAVVGRGEVVDITGGLEDLYARMEGPNQRKRFTLKDLKEISPIEGTRQDEAFHLWNDETKSVIGLLSCPGVGKTFLATYLALRDLLTPGNGYEKVVFIRSAVATRDIGFLPGDMEEKIAVFEEPYIGIFDELFPWKKSYENLKKSGKVEFRSSSFLRGISLHNTIVIVDEVQSMNFHELDTIVTRLGENSRLLLCGDTKQNDLLYRKNDQSGLGELLSILKDLPEFGAVEFGPEDIVRSGFVKAYITKKWEMNL